MNSMQLKDKLKLIAKDKNVDFNTLLRKYMFDRFIERLSKSKYKDNFIIKGGFYLSTLFGVENRTTMDIDAAFRYGDFNKDNIINIINEIISIDIDDDVKIAYLGIDSIRDEDEYGGFRVDLQIKIERVKEVFNLDIVTGDPITPKEIKYKYKPLLSDNYINVWAYNLETVLSEKIETIFSRLELNGRMRDFYDIYLIYNNEWKFINKDVLKEAYNNTCIRRSFNGNIKEIFEVIKNSNSLKRRWNYYKKKYDYANNISFNDILICLEKMINCL